MMSGDEWKNDEIFTHDENYGSIVLFSGIYFYLKTFYLYSILSWKLIRQIFIFNQ